MPGTVTTGYDLASGINRPLTDGASDTCPIWSSDGKEITYASDEDTKRFIYTMPVDGSGRRIQMQGARRVPNDWSQDNRNSKRQLQRRQTTPGIHPVLLLR